MVASILLSGLLCCSSVRATSMSFESFVARYGKQYTSTAERGQRREIFERNIADIAKLNAQSQGGATFAINEFADVTPEEFARTHKLSNAALGSNLAKRNASYTRTNAAADRAAPPASKNWFGSATTGIRDQGQCGSCWAFSAVEQVESDWFLSGKSGWTQPQALSVQQVVDCDTVSAHGCSGTYAGGGGSYDFIAKNGGLASETNYPYTSGKTKEPGECKHGIATSGGVISNHTYAIKPCGLPWDDCNDQDEDALVQYVGASGPLAICVNAHTWQFYKGGVMDGATCGRHDFASLDHCVQLVGYSGHSGDSAYWIVRNSWVFSGGKPWGEDGLIYLAMGNNTCGLANVPSHAII